MKVISTRGGIKLGGGFSWSRYWATLMLASYKSINSHITFTPAQETLILERLSEDYVLTTFGTKGSHKTVCDFFLFFENSNTTTNLTARGITKTGDTLRWNYGNGNVYSQNNLPAQTNNGVITVTSTDGFNAVTTFNLSINTFIGGLFNLNYYMPALTVLNVGTNAFTGVIPSIPHVMVQFDISANNFTSGIPADFANNPHMTEFKCYQNHNLTGEIINTVAAPNSNLNTLDCLETGITGIHLTSFSPVMVLLRVQSCDIPTADLDALLAGMNTFYTTYGALVNLTVNLTGDFNGYITNGLLNADYVALVALWAGAGKTLTCSFNSNPGAFNKGKVLFTFDDVALSVHTIGLPLFNSKSIVGTVYANNAYVGAALPYGENGCDWAELLALEAAGWTVGSHGDTHVSYGTLTEAQMITDVEASIAEFVSEGLASPLFFSYPQGSYNATSKGVMQTYFRSARIVGNLGSELQTAFLGKNSDPYLTLVVFTDLAQYTIADLDLVKKYIDKANADKTAIIFLTHGIAATPADQYHVSIAFLTAIIDYIQTLDMDIINDGTLIDLMNPRDRDENIYTTAVIGTQTWMKENLKTTKYRNGVAITNVTGDVNWAALSTEAYCWYGDNIVNKIPYGALYNFPALIDANVIAPKGWHVATDAEYITLIAYLATNQGGKLKEAGTIHWLAPNTNATNSSDFTALPGGNRAGASGAFGSLTTYGCFWTATQQSGTHGRYYYMANTDGNITLDSVVKNYGMTVRLIKD